MVVVVNKECEAGHCLVIGGHVHHVTLIALWVNLKDEELTSIN